MADDTSDPNEAESNKLREELEERRARGKRRAKEYPQTQASKMWDALKKDDNPVNEMPGGTYNSAGGKPKELSWRDAFNTDLLNPRRPYFFQTGCGRDSLLVGMSAGGAAGGLHFILRGLSAIAMSANIAVGAFAVTSCGMYYWCDQRKREEARGMALAVAGMRKLNERKAREKRELEEAAQKAEEEARKGKWKFW